MRWRPSAMSEAQDSEIESFLRGHGPFEKQPICSCGTSVGDWKVLAFLGRGGSSEVYRAENTVTGLVAALKILVKADDKTRERFKREVRLLAEMRNATFPKFYGAGEMDGRFYVAEELLEPVVLPSQDAEVARFLLDVAAGVDELHRRGFVHRDIKPRNVMVRPATDENVLIDLGLAKESADTPQARADTLSVVDDHAVGVGTPGYSAPEQFAGGVIGPATDIHALGMLANACFGGKPPKVWAQIIRRSTSSIPEQRYPSVTEFVRAIRRRHAARWRVVGCLVAATVVVVAIALWSNGDSPPEALAEQESPITAEKLWEVVYDLQHEGLKTKGAVRPEGDRPHAEDDKSGKNKGDGPEIARNLIGFGKTVHESDIPVTTIVLDGRDILIPGETRLEGNRKIKIIGPGRLTASITGMRGVSLELSERAALVNLTTTPYSESDMTYVLCGACYLNFKNLDSPSDRNYGNIQIDTFTGNGMPVIRFHGPDSYEEARKADKQAALESMRKGVLPSY